MVGQTLSIKKFVKHIKQRKVTRQKEKSQPSLVGQEYSAKGRYTREYIPAILDIFPPGDAHRAAAGFI